MRSLYCLEFGCWRGLVALCDAHPNWSGIRTDGVGDEAPGDCVFVKYCALFVCEQVEKKVVGVVLYECGWFVGILDK